MIFVDRRALPEPSIFTSKRMDAWRAEARDQNLEASAGQNKPTRNTKFYNRVRPELHRLFHHKCAYCETQLPTRRDGDIELFRPLSRAINLDGKMAPGYWWLAFEWSNFYLACAQCNRTYKRNRFPVHGSRLQYGGQVANEEALLLDPCLTRDFEEMHFYYVDDPALQEVAMVPETKRGKVSIEILGLNRADLRRRRFGEWEKFQLLLEHSLVNTAAPAQPTIERSIRSSLDDDSPFLGMKRAQAEIFFQRHGAELDARFPGLIASLRLAAIVDRIDLAFSLSIEAEPSSAGESFRSPGSPDDAPPKASAAVGETKDAQPSRSARQKRPVKARSKADYSVYDTTKASRERYFGSLKRIEKVVINNFRVIRHLELELGQGSGVDSSWLALIGENSTGKSTVLKAIALALMGDKERADLRLDAREYVNKDAEHGSVQVHLTNLPPIELTFSKKQVDFRSTSSGPKVLILGYGATRLLRRWTDEVTTDRERRLIRIQNLFNPYEKLNHVEKWLGDIQKVPAEQFGMVRDALMDLLLLDPATDSIRRQRGRVLVKLGGSSQRLEEMSDGYQSVLALTLDIMMVLTAKWPSIEDAEGIVLIDEIGVHLHPRWKMQIIEKLRQTFPGLQFLVTTHEPLCLRGLEQGQVVLMKRSTDGNVQTVTDLPSPNDFRVDQLLTSEFFGLHSAMDPDTEKAFNEYYQLLALEAPNATQQERLEELKGELADRQHLGATPREELMYEVIDKLLADKRHRRPERTMDDVKQEAVDRIAKLWKSKFSGSTSTRPNSTRPDSTRPDSTTP